MTAPPTWRNNYKAGTCFEPGKRRFYDEDEAVQAAQKMTAKRGRAMTYYACGNHFHLTKAKMVS